MLVPHVSDPVLPCRNQPSRAGQVCTERLTDAGWDPKVLQRQNRSTSANATKRSNFRRMIARDRTNRLQKGRATALC